MYGEKVIAQGIITYFLSFSQSSWFYVLLIEYLILVIVHCLLYTLLMCDDCVSYVQPKCLTEQQFYIAFKRYFVVINLLHMAKVNIVFMKKNQSTESMWVLAAVWVRQ